jgi:hypothetical protein
MRRRAGTLKGMKNPPRLSASAPPREKHTLGNQAEAFPRAAFKAASSAPNSNTEV